MNLKTLSISTVLFVTTVSCSAFAKHHEGPFEKIWYSAKMREGIKGKTEFELKVTSDRKLFHHRDEVKIKVKALDKHEARRENHRDDGDNRICYKVEFKGHGRLFQDLKDDLEDQFDNGNEMVEELHHVRIKRHSLDAVICDASDVSDDTTDFDKVDKVEKSDKGEKSERTDRNDESDD